LREIEISLRSQYKKWYHLGLTSVARSTLADANSKRSADILKDVFYDFLSKCQALSPDHRFRFKNSLFIFDSTLIKPCLSMFPWAEYRKRKGAMKIHALLDHRGCLPSFLRVTKGNCSDIKVVKEKKYCFPRLLPDSIITVDRAYIDYNWFYSLTLNRVFFVTRAKKNTKYEVIGQQEVPKNKNVISDEIIRLTDKETKKDYPERLRLITYYDKEKNVVLVFLTNNFKLAASTIAEIYKNRWQIEVFFKWIKQNLKIKTFLGTSENAVMTRIWAAMIYYLLLSFIKFQTKLSYELQELTRIIRELLMENVSLLEILRITLHDYKRLKLKT